MENESLQNQPEPAQNTQSPEWKTPDFEETTVNAEVAAYYSGDMESGNAP